MTMDNWSIASALYQVTQAKRLDTLHSDKTRSAKKFLVEQINNDFFAAAQIADDLLDNVTDGLEIEDDYPDSFPTDDD